MLYAIPCAALTAALALTLVALAAAVRRCRRLHQDLTVERVNARLDQQTWALDVQALQDDHRRLAAAAAAEEAVLAAADAILTHALTTTRPDLPRGGGSDG